MCQVHFSTLRTPRLRGTVRVALLALLVGCKGSSDLTGLGEALKCGFSDFCPVPASPRVSIIGSPGPFGVGDTVRFSARLRDTLGVVLTGRTFQWSSLDKTKATISAT